MAIAWSLGQTVVRMSMMALLVTLAACASPAVRTPPTRTPSPTVSPVPFPSPLTGLLDPAPTRCPAGPTALPLDSFTIDETFGGGFIGGDVFVGRSPVWNLGLRAGGSLSLESLYATPSPFPYPVFKVLWVVGPNYHQPVTLSGHEVSTGAPVWFDLSAVGSGPGNPVTTAVLDPAHPNRGDTGNASGVWNIWGIALFFFASGCYQVTAAWAGGSWQVLVAVGR